MEWYRTKGYPVDGATVNFCITQYTAHPSEGAKRAACVCPRAVLGHGYLSLISQGGLFACKGSRKKYLP